LRVSSLAAVAIPQLSAGSYAPFLAAPLLRCRLLGAALSTLRSSSA